MSRFIRFAFASLALFATLVVSLDGTAHGQVRRPSLIRDAEIENTIRAYAKPVFEAAGIDADFAQIYLVRSSELNAFVAGGQNIFITTGLLIKAATAEQVIGVLAHETGHITGGHLARMKERMETASHQAMIAQILALLVGVGTGQPGAAAAVSLGGVGLAERGLLAYSRAQEQAADQAALGFLDEAGISAQGLAEFLDTLAGQEFLLTSRQDPYVRTHPLTRDRVAFVENHARRSPFADKPLPAGFAERHRRMQAKLIGFLEPPDQVLQKYPESDTSADARYARAIAFYRIPDLARALPLIEGLIAEQPNNPYFHEIKGQILFENSRVAEAVAPYKKAVALAPEQPLLYLGLAHAQMETNRPEMVKPAIANLQAALRREPESLTGWQLAATAYGRDGQFGESALALAELNLRGGNRAVARQQATRAERILTPGSPSWLRAQDIKRTTEKQPR